MSVANELQRIVNAKKDIAGKIAEMGLEYYDDDAQSYVTVSVDENGDPNDTIDELAEALDSIDVVEVDECKEYVSMGFDYATGSIKVEMNAPLTKVVKGSTEWVECVTEDLPVQEGKTITPAKEGQVAVNPYKWVLDQIYVNPIPDEYVDVSNTDASPSQVVSGVKFVGANGEVEEGTMTNRGAIDVKLNPSIMPTQSYPILEGYHDGNGKVYWEYTPLKTVTPTNETQNILPELGTMGLSRVIVNPIPEEYVDTTDITKDADDLTVDEHVVNVPAGYYPQAVSTRVPRLTNLDAVVNPLDEMAGTDPGGNPVLYVEEIGAYVKTLYLYLDPSLEEALAAI